MLNQTRIRVRLTLNHIGVTAANKLKVKIRTNINEKERLSLCMRMIIKCISCWIPCFRLNYFFVLSFDNYFNFQKTLHFIFK